jgi:hypothetical protein
MIYTALGKYNYLRVTLWFLVNLRVIILVTRSYTKRTRRTAKKILIFLPSKAYLIIIN